MRSKLSKDDLKQLTKSTFFDEEELQKWYKDFLTIAPSGKLDLTGLNAIYQKFFPKGDTTEFTKNVFRTIALDGCDEISFREFIAKVSQITRGTIEQKLAWIYDMFDIQKKGSVSMQDVRYILLTAIELHGTFVHHGENSRKDRYLKEIDSVIYYLFRKLDTDSNGSIGSKEFLQGAQHNAAVLKYFSLQSTEGNEL